jgi:hypothetical protein
VGLKRSVPIDSLTLMPRRKIAPSKIAASQVRRAYVPPAPADSARKAGAKGQSRIMYIENKSGGLSGGGASIGRVTFSKTRSTVYYQGRAFQSLKGRGYKANYIETETGDQYWISGPKKNGEDRLYGERVGVEIDEDVREEYWIDIRNDPSRKSQACT